MIIPYGRHKISQEDIESVNEVLHSNYLTQGPVVSQFEEQVAEYCGAKKAVAVCNGTAALHLAMLVLGIGPGDSVVVPSLSFLASANCIEFVSAKPIFVDMDPKSYCLDLNQVEEHLKNDKSIKAIISVDFAGLPVPAQGLKNLADKYSVKIVEDACHAFGSDYKDDSGWHKTGASTCSDISIFSFHPVKHLTTGEGGMLLTNDESLDQRIRYFACHGMRRNISKMRPWYYEMEDVGYNFRITDIQCALGISQLKNIDVWVKKRRQIASAYHEVFKSFKNIVIPLSETESSKSSFHLYVIQVDDRDGLYLKLKEEDILTQVHYMPIHLQPYYRNKYGLNPGSLPVTEEYSEKCLTLPCYVDLDIGVCHDIAEKIIHITNS